MDDWEKLNEILSSENEDFYSNENMEVSTYRDFRHMKRVWEDF